VGSKRKKRGGGAQRRRPLSELQRFARHGDLLHDGQFIVTRVDLAHGQVFDNKGRKLAWHEIDAYEGDLYTDQKCAPSYMGVRNWFGIEREDTQYGVSQMDDTRHNKWRANYDANLPLIERGAGDVEPADVVYLVASGPGLERNAQELTRITNGVKVAVNWTMDWASANGLGDDIFDYYVCIDYFIDPRSAVEHPNTIGVFDVVVNPKVPQRVFKDRRWFCSAAQTGNPVGKLAKERDPFLPDYDSGLNVLFSAMQWVTMGLKAKTVVFVGADCALTWNRYHCGEWADYKRFIPAEFTVVADIHGHMVVTTKMLNDIADWMQAAFFFMQRAGVRVINATESGILDQYCELKPLADTVDELNGTGGDNEIRV